MTDIAGAMEAVRVEIAKITPQPGDLVVLRFGKTLTRDMQRSIAEWWDKMFPGVPMATIEPGSDISILRPEGASLRALAEALRPILAELDRDGSLGA